MKNGQMIKFEKLVLSSFFSLSQCSSIFVPLFLLIFENFDTFCCGSTVRINSLYYFLFFFCTSWVFLLLRIVSIQICVLFLHLSPSSPPTSSSLNNISPRSYRSNIKIHRTKFFLCMKALYAESDNRFSFPVWFLFYCFIILWTENHHRNVSSFTMMPSKFER